MDSVTSTAESKKTADTAAPRETVSITDNRSGKSYEIPITHGTIRAMDFRQIKVDANDFGMMSYDLFFNNTATTEIYTLSLHDALPISPVARRRSGTAAPDGSPPGGWSAG